ncbi:uncharacterized protein LY79DRAFT_47954 [Colletotrichum navitas]|uniref:Extracellular membrane protein CFEM domain-containing protein n=1 Tax=Colletotrichum navitas TaxID=681940 RepID=A0AAD8Q5Z5_9PEZI|nr:uncharacterized protein LY79DRAFT_47954 [Colletotrichum navitas]KAK1596550.1 hypothetical protein LY79DRAFT_47954 [Colletotrichum navitas]
MPVSGFKAPSSSELCLLALGVALQCGCQSINGCYCNTALGSSATSYMSSCISKGCSKVNDWSVDMTSMLNLYDSYWTLG